MEQDNPLLEHPFFSEPVIDPNRARQALTLEDRVSSLNEPLPEPLTGKEVLKDVGQSALTGLAKGAAGVAIGGPGSIGSTASDVLNLVKGAGAYLGEKMDIISPEERQRMAAEPVISGQTPEEKAGLVDPITGWPTYKAVTESFKPMAKAAGVEMLAHEPQSPQGKIAETAAEFATQGIPGALKTLPGRVVTGGSAGAGSELLAQSAQGDDEAYNRAVGALAGAGIGAVGSGIAGSIVKAAKALAMPEAVGAKSLADAYAADLRRGAAMTPEQVAEAQARGVEVSFADMGGPEVKALLGRAAESTAANQELASARNEFVNERRRQSGARLSNDITGQFGGNLDAPALQQLQEESGKLIRNQVYGVARAAPEAQAINQANFSGLLDRPTFQDAMKRAEKTAVDAPDFKIKPPQTIAGTPGTEQTFQQTPRGLVEVPATQAVPDRVVPGNLSYWDQVQRELKSMSEIEARRGDNTAKATIDGMREDLLKTLDKVPGYKDARGTAFETFQAASAPEAGAKFFANMDDFKRSDLRQAFNQMNPEQKELFAAGFASKLNEAAAGGDVAGLAKKFTKDGNFQERALAVLGPERYAKIQGSVLSEDMLSKIKELKFIQQSSGLGSAMSAGATGAVGLDALVSGIHGMSPDMAVKAAVGAVVGAAGQTVLSATEKRIASTILPLAVSTDPKDTARLGQLAMRSPAVGDILNKFSTAISNTISAAQSHPSPREGRATGGAVNLMALSKAAKKHVTRSTEDLLNVDDSTVARALEVANKHI